MSSCLYGFEWSFRGCKGSRHARVGHASDERYTTQLKSKDFVFIVSRARHGLVSSREAKTGRESVDSRHSRAARRAAGSKVLDVSGIAFLRPGIIAIVRIHNALMHKANRRARPAPGPRAARRVYLVSRQLPHTMHRRTSLEAREGGGAGAGAGYLAPRVATRYRSHVRVRARADRGFRGVRCRARAPRRLRGRTRKSTHEQMRQRAHEWHLAT